MLTVISMNGEQYVIEQGDIPNSKKMISRAGPFTSSREAWHWIDMQTGEPLNKKEETTDWAVNKRLKGEF